jgi:mycofactocin precursor
MDRDRQNAVNDEVDVDGVEAGDPLGVETLIEDVSIDGMCGVY